MARTRDVDRGCPLSGPFDQRFRHLVARVHDLGPAPLVHLLIEIDRGANLVPTLERYAALPTDFIRAMGGDRYLTPLRAVGGRH